MPRRRDVADRAEASAVARAFAARQSETTAASARLERKILEELIYERVRVAVDMCRLMEFELDLASSIERALSACAESPIMRVLFLTHGKHFIVTSDPVGFAW